MFDPQAWTLWASDSFDREAPPAEEGCGIELVAGLTLLWKKYLDEGIDDHGTATFTDFELRWGRGTMGETAAVSVNVWPFDWKTAKGAARLRAWARLEPSLLHEIAGAHARLIASIRPTKRSVTGLEESTTLLALAATAADVAAFGRALAEVGTGTAS